MKQILFVFIAALGLNCTAHADYWDLQHAQDQQQAANAQASAEQEAVKGRDDLNRELTAYVNKFIAAHHGVQGEIKASYGDYGYDVKVSGSIEELDFTTNDNYECKADWGDEYDFEVHIELNCINSLSGKRIDLYPSRFTTPLKRKVAHKRK